MINCRNTDIVRDRRFLFVRPNRELASARLAKMETAACGKVENVARYLSAKIDNLRFRRLQVAVIENDERRTSVQVRGSFRSEKTASHPAVIKRGIIRPVIDERPTEKRREEFLRLREIARGHLNIVDRVRQ